MANKYLDSTGLSNLWAKIKESFCTYDEFSAELDRMNAVREIYFENDGDDASLVYTTYDEATHGISLLEYVYPIGSIYLSINSTNPSELFGGTWEQIQDTFLLAAGETYTAGETGGEAEHTLTTNEMPSHNHSWGGVNTGSTMTKQMGQYPFYIYADYKQNWSGRQASMGSTGGGKAHNNMPPYLVVYVWKRTA